MKITTSEGKEIDLWEGLSQKERAIELKRIAIKEKNLRDFRKKKEAREDKHKRIVNFRLSKSHRDTLERLAAERKCKTVDIIRDFLDLKINSLNDIRRRRTELLTELQNLNDFEEMELGRLNI
jgi:hypothetical protein